MLRLREDELEWREIDEEIVVLDGRSAAYMAVTGAGTVIWRRLAEGCEPDALVQALVQTYAIPTTQAAQDVDEFLDRLREHGLLSEVAALVG